MRSRPPHALPKIPPLHRLAQLMALPHAGEAFSAKSGQHADHLLHALWDVMMKENLARDPAFAHLSPADPDAPRLMHSAQHNNGIDPGEELWLNRQLVDAAFRRETGKPCFRTRGGFDTVLVSDAGKQFKITSTNRRTGLISTAMRSTDIAMDRVWQLEVDTFLGTSGFVFAPISRVIEQDEDPTALHPEVQRMTADIRTDLDRFSPLEISSLIRHGYCVGRSACRRHPDLFGETIPVKPPWDPTSAANLEESTADSGPPIEDRGSKIEAPSSHSHVQSSAPVPEPVLETVESRKLQKSAGRRLWSTLLDYRDWTSYIYVPIIVPLLTLLPYFIVKAYERSHRLNQIVKSLAQGSRDLEHMSRLLESGPTEHQISETAEEVKKVDKPDFISVDVFQDSFIFDLRHWKPSVAGKNDPDSFIHHYRRVKVAKKPQNTAAGDIVRWQLLTTDPKAVFTFPRQRVAPTLRKCYDAAAADKGCQWELSFDLQKVPADDFVDLMVEYRSSGRFLERGENATTVSLPIVADTAEMTMWVLMPRGREYEAFHITRHKTGNSEKVEPVRVVTEYLASDYTILAFKLLSLKGGYTYEVNWMYK